MGICCTEPDLCIITEYVERGSLYTLLMKNSSWIFEVSPIFSRDSPFAKISLMCFVVQSNSNFQKYLNILCPLLHFH